MLRHIKRGYVYLADNLASWSVVRNFGTVSYFTVSYAVLIGVPILLNVYVLLAPTFNWLRALAPFPETLRWMYGASLLYLTSLVLYKIVCPDTIAHFHTQTEFVEAELNSAKDAYPLHRVNIVLAQLRVGAGEAQDRESIERLLSERDRAEGREVERIDEELNKIADKYHPSMVRRALRDEYDKDNLSYRWARSVSFMSYVVATIIMVGLVGQRSYAVLKHGREEANMLIDSTYAGLGASRMLLLNAYSSYDAEFDLLDEVLKEAQINQAYRAIPGRDSFSARTYSLKDAEVASLEQVLQGTFDNIGAFTAVGGAGTDYKCEEMTRAGPGAGCETLQATGPGAATVSCGLVASRRKWFAGAASPGACRP